MFVCPELSSPKPLDQSKNVTVRTYHKLSKDQNEQKKIGQKMSKRATIHFSLLVQLGNYWTNQKMLLEGLITNSAGIKMGQKMAKKC